jgi:hypothetical protein
MAIDPQLRPRQTITREEFIELRAQVGNIAHSVEQLAATVATGQKEWELNYNSALARIQSESKADIARVESDSRGRFEKNEEIAANKAKSDTEGRRWLIGTLAASLGLLVYFGNLWTGSIREGVLLEVRNELTPVKEQNATSIKDRSDMHDVVMRHIDQIGTINSTLSSLTAGYDAKLIEIETQFRADAQARNIQFSEQQRQNQNFQNALSDLGAKMPHAPTGLFYHPDISGQHDGNR